MCPATKTSQKKGNVGTEALSRGIWCVKEKVSVLLWDLSGVWFDKVGLPDFNRRMLQSLWEEFYSFSSPMGDLHFTHTQSPRLAMSAMSFENPPKNLEFSGYG